MNTDADTPPPPAILDACALALCALAAIVCEPLPSDAAPRAREQSLRLALAACAGALCAALEQHTAGHLGADLDAGAREGAGEARAHAARLASVAQLAGSFNGGRVDAP